MFTVACASRRELCDSLLPLIFQVLWLWHIYNKKITDDYFNFFKKWLYGKEKVKRNLWYSSWGLPLCVILLANRGPFVKVRLIKATGEGISGFALRGLKSYKEHSVANSDTNISAGLNGWNLSECVICGTKWKRSCSSADSSLERDRQTCIRVLLAQFKTCIFMVTKINSAQILLS